MEALQLNRVKLVKDMQDVINCASTLNTYINDTCYLGENISLDYIEDMLENIEIAVEEVKELVITAKVQEEI